MERGQEPRRSSFSWVLTPTLSLGSSSSSRASVHKVRVVTGLASSLTSLGFEAPGKDRGEFQVERSTAAFLTGWRRLSVSGGPMAEDAGNSPPKLGKVAQTLVHSRPSQGKERPVASPGPQTSGCIVCAQLGCRPGPVSWELPVASEEGREIWPQWPRLAPLFFADTHGAASPSCPIIFPQVRTPSQS